MKQAKVYTVTILIGIIALIGAYQQGTLQAEAEVAPAKIAVCNVTKVITNCQKFKDWQAEKQEEIKQIDAELNAMQEDLAALNENLKIRTPGSEDHAKLMKEFIEKKAAYQAKDAGSKELWDAQREQWTEMLYQQLLGVIDEIATKKGYDIVLASEDLNLSDPMRPEITQTIVTKKILYHKMKFDITEEVLAALNAK
jgi:Skp family chaperone for outer membrane proteins